MTSGPTAICWKCRHFKPKSYPFSCPAFPDGIPREILLGGNEHEQPLPEQKNKIVFQKKGLGGIS